MITMLSEVSEHHQIFRVSQKQPSIRTTTENLRAVQHEVLCQPNFMHVSG